MVSGMLVFGLKVFAGRLLWMFTIVSVRMLVTSLMMLMDQDCIYYYIVDQNS